MAVIAKPYLLFDAGGTVVFPDFRYLSRTVDEFGINLTEQELFRIHSIQIYNLDFVTSQKKIFIDPFPESYTRTLFGLLNIPENILENLITLIEDRNRYKSVWSLTKPFVQNALKRLKNEGYQMSVISNSDGRASEIFRDLDLSRYFDQIFDSEILKVSKPDPLIFEIAVNQLSLDTNNTIYIGDIFYLDVWGANYAGIGAIHIDPFDLYKEWPGIHLKDISYLPGWLENYSESPWKYDLYPLRNQKIEYRLNSSK